MDASEIEALVASGEPWPEFEREPTPPHTSVVDEVIRDVLERVYDSWTSRPESRRSRLHTRRDHIARDEEDPRGLLTDEVRAARGRAYERREEGGGDSP